MIGGEELAGEHKEGPRVHDSMQGKHGVEAGIKASSPRVFGTTMKAQRGCGAQWSRRWLPARFGGGVRDREGEREGNSSTWGFKTLRRRAEDDIGRHGSSGRC